MSDTFHPLLQYLITTTPLPPDQIQDLARRGAIATLEAENTPEAIQGLGLAVWQGLSAAVSDQALEALRRLSRAGSAAAGAELYQLAVGHDQAAAQAAIALDDLAAPDPTTQVLFQLLTGQPGECLQLDGDHRRLTAAFLPAAEPLRRRLLAAAERAGWQGWTAFGRLLMENTPKHQAGLVAAFGTLTPAGQAVVLETLAQLAQSGEAAAGEVLCELFIAWDDERARQLAGQHGLVPAEDVQRALFLFLAGQWEAYERLDFSHSLINTAYAAAEPALRRRILAQSRYSGRIEWLQSAEAGRPRRWLKDLNDADWDYTLKQLQERQAWDELWRLAQSAPPVWGVRILALLQQADWRAGEPAEAEFFQTLIPLAADCRTRAPEVYLQKTLSTPEPSLTALALSPDGQTLAAGGTGQAIHRWHMPRGAPLEPAIIGSAAQTRALVFSPGGDYLVSASGDQAIRVYRSQDGKLMKTLTGHTGIVRALAVHPDGRTLFSAGFDGQLRAWRFPLGPDSQVVHASPGELFTLAIDPAGQLLLTGGAAGVLQTISWPAAQPVQTLTGHGGSITCLSLSESGQLAASYGRDQTVRLWNPAGGRELRQIPVPGPGLTGLCFAPGEQVVIGAGVDGRLVFWNTATGVELFSILRAGKPVTGLALYRPEALLISAGSDGEIHCWGLGPFLLARTPVELSSPTQIQQLEATLGRANQTTASRNWLAYLLELLRWKGRYDIQVSENRPIQLGEFDIEL